MNFAQAQPTRVTPVAVFFAAVALLCAGTNEAVAQGDRTWTGGGDGLWSNRFDWGGLLEGVRSVGDYNLLFSGTSRTTNTNDLDTVNISTLSFTNNGSAGQTAVFTLNGSDLSLANSLITTTSASGLATSGDVINNRLLLTGSNTASTASGHSLTIAGDISGVAASLLKAGAGSLYLTGSNSQSGTTYITGGNVRTGSGGASSDSNNYALGTGAVVVSGSGTLAVRNSSTVANNLTIGGTGGSGATGSLAGSFGASNQTAVVAGSVTLSSDALISTWGSTGVLGNKLSLTGPINIGANKLTFTRVVTGSAGTSIEASGVIAGTGLVVVDGNANVSLNGASSYSGGTTLQSGIIHAGSSTALGTGSVAMNAGVLDLNGRSLSIGALSGSNGSLITSLAGGSASILTNTGGAQATYAGSITNGLGVVSLTKAGAGSLYLTGSNSQTGTTYITGGNVRTGSGGASSDSNNYALGTGAVVVSGSGTLAVRNSSTVANNLTIGGTGGSGATGSLAGSFGASNQTAVVAGSVTLSSDALISTWGSTGVVENKLSLTGPINIGANKLTFTRVVTGSAGTSIEASGVIAGTGSVVVDGNANVSLNGASSYSGGTTLQNGIIHAGSSTALGTGSVAMNAGVLDLNGRSLLVGALSGSNGSLITSLVGGSASILTNTAGAQATFAGSITNGLGVVSLTKAGAGSLYLTGSNSQTGTTYITGGNVRTGSGGASSDSNNYALGTGAVVVSGSGTLAVRNSSTVANNLTIGGVGGSGATGSLAGSFGASGQTAIVSGNVTLSSDALVSTWGSTGVTGSKLSLAGPINIGGNKLTFTQVVTDVSRSPTAGAATWVTVGGVIAGTGSVVVDNNATVYLNGANTYTGPTTVQSGVLGGDGTIAGDVIVQNGATLTPGSEANAIGALSVGSLQLDAGATTAMSIAGTDVSLYDQVVALGNVNFGGALDIDFESAGFVKFDFWQLFSGATSSGHFSSISATGAYGDLKFQHVGGGEWQATGGSLGAGEMLLFFEQNSNPYVSAGQLVLVPEPSTIVFAGIGLLVVGWRRWSRRRSPQPSLDAVAV